ncbi:hypothetical protein JOD69_003812 [Methylocaldum sp. RMAD-M]|nr:hypothetical protein [Methylocaldum sp. RMAD-M]
MNAAGVCYRFGTRSDFRQTPLALVKRLSSEPDAAMGLERGRQKSPITRFGPV